MKKKFTEQVVEALKYGVKRYGSAAELCRRTGVSNANMTRWLQGTGPKIGQIAPVFDDLGINLDLPGEEMVEYDLVPKHAARAGAGASLETSAEVEGMYAFRKDWMASQGIHVKNAVLLDVVGDSMEPLLHEGDSLLIDKQDTEIRDGKIYVVTLGEELRVKRIYRSLNGLILRSENTRYPDVPVDGPDLETFIIHGRVKWCGKIL